MQSGRRHVDRIDLTVPSPMETDRGRLLQTGQRTAPLRRFTRHTIRAEGTKVLEELRRANQDWFEMPVLCRFTCPPTKSPPHPSSLAYAAHIKRIDEARATGWIVTLDQYPYGAPAAAAFVYVRRLALPVGWTLSFPPFADPQQLAEDCRGRRGVFVSKLFEAGQSPTQTPTTP